MVVVAEVTALANHMAMIMEALMKRKVTTIVIMIMEAITEGVAAEAEVVTTTIEADTIITVVEMIPVVAAEDMTIIEVEMILVVAAEGAAVATTTTSTMAATLILETEVVAIKTIADRMTTIVWMICAFRGILFLYRICLRL